MSTYEPRLNRPCLTEEKCKAGNQHVETCLTEEKCKPRHVFGRAKRRAPQALLHQISQARWGTTELIAPKRCKRNWKL